MTIPADILAQFDEPTQRWLVWCADEYDPCNPYHDAWDPDGWDNYACTVPYYGQQGVYLARRFAVMCDAQTYVTPDGKAVSLIRDT